MRALYAVLSEILHLFVDDGAFAVSLLACCAIARVALAFLPALATLWGPLLVLGCAAALVSNVAVTARRRSTAVPD